MFGGLLTCTPLLSEASRFPLARDQIRPDSRKGAKYSIKITQTVLGTSHLSIFKLVRHLLGDKTTGSFHRRAGESPEWIIRVFVFTLFSARYWANEQCSCEFNSY